ncbi:MAG: right-handed parallel beta-helix repeat-containing protein [Planctomycetota bacterium]|nr:right-handed parallel beta-helix repeat-containing protein [Planctomycetota bacterium]
MFKPLAVLASAALATVAQAQTAGHWRLESLVGPVAADFGPNGLDGIHNGLGAIGSNVPVSVVPLLELDNLGVFRTQWQDASTCGVVRVDDPNEDLRMGASDFTIEAWVRLSQNSTNGGANQRQHLCFKKRLSAQDLEIDYAFLVQAGDLGTSGNELAFRVGDGANVTTVVSTLEITDLEWHHVSAAYDASRQTLRFGIDGVFDEIVLEKQDYPPYLEGGPLEIGGRRNASNAYSQFLRGSIDELRVSRLFLEPSRLLTAASTDCDGNGVADELDIAADASIDCNSNAVLDSCELADQPDLDCNDDGTIDTCQIDPFRYVLDDGDSEALVNSDGTNTAWMNLMFVEEGHETVTGIEILMPANQIGDPFGLYLWTDPNGNGIPDDCTVIAGIENLVIDEVALLTFDFPAPVTIGPAGTPFFVGAVASSNFEFPATLDITAPHTFGRSWVIGRNGPINPDDLMEEVVEMNLIELFIAGNWVVRAVDESSVIPYEDCNRNGVDDACDLEAGTSVDTDGDGIPDECGIPGIFDVPGDFDTIAVAASIVAPGSEIVVGPGTYTDRVDNFGKDLVIRSSDGPAATIIDLGYASRTAFWIDGSGGGNMVIDGFTITRSGETGIFINDSSPLVTNCIIEDAISDVDGTAIFIRGNSSPVIESCIIRNNDGSADGGPAITVNTTSPGLATIRDCQVVDNRSDFLAGGILGFSAPIIVEGCEVSRNFSRNSQGSGITLLDDYDNGVGSVIRNNVIAENTFLNNQGEGGGIYAGFSETSVIEGNLIRGNIGSDGGGVYVRIGATLINNTFVDNSTGSGGRGGGLFIEVTATPVPVTNCIFWGNRSGDGDQIHLTDSGLADVSYSCVEGGYLGVGNIAFDPQFVSGGTGDFRLLEGSPCVDAGDDAASTPGIVDLDGEDRIVGAAIDMGCYENQDAAGTCFGDLDGNGVVNGADLALVLAEFGSKGRDLLADLDGNMVVNGADLAGVLAAWGVCP